MGKRPKGLECPTCANKAVLYHKRSGSYWCRRCGTEFQITRVGRGVEYQVIFTPPGIKSIYKKPAQKKN